MNKDNALKLFLYLVVFMTYVTCSKDDAVEEEIVNAVDDTLTDYQLSVIDYFKEVALGFEFSNASRVTRKWRSEMKINVGGNPSTELMDELEKIVGEINELATDGFTITIVDDSSDSNYYLFFGPGEEYANLYPDVADYVESNWGFFYIFWNENNTFNNGHMYVDTERPTLAGQKHLLREELTQSLGLARDSSEYPESIFQSEWTETNDYATIDKDLIRLLYHPSMSSGLNSGQADGVLRTILSEE